MVAAAGAQTRGQLELRFGRTHLRASGFRVALLFLLRCADGRMEPALLPDTRVDRRASDPNAGYDTTLATTTQPTGDPEAGKVNWGHIEAVDLARTAPGLDDLAATIDPQLKVFVYKLQFGDAMAVARRYPLCTKFQWAGDYHLIKRFKASDYHTTDPHDADFYVVPFLAKCYLNNVAHGVLKDMGNGFAQLMRELETYPQWRARPDRHLFFFMSGIGASMLPSPPGWAAVPRLAKSIFVVAEGDREADYFRYGHDIVVPGWVTAVQPVREVRRGKDIVGFFRGGATAGLKDAYGMRRLKPNLLRRTLFTDMAHEEGFIVGPKAASYSAEIIRSVFCIIPRGNTPWTRRFFDAVLAGCIPVVLSDPISFAFERLINFHEFTIKVPERNTSTLASLLRSVPRDVVNGMGRELLRWQRAFDFGSGGRAFELLLVELTLRKNASVGRYTVPLLPRTVNSPQHFWDPHRGVYKLPGARKLGPTWGGAMIAHRR